MTKLRAKALGREKGKAQRDLGLTSEFERGILPLRHSEAYSGEIESGLESLGSLRSGGKSTKRFWKIIFSQRPNCAQRPGRLQSGSRQNRLGAKKFRIGCLPKSRAEDFTTKARTLAVRIHPEISGPQKAGSSGHSAKCSGEGQILLENLASFLSRRKGTKRSKDSLRALK